jgi:hypothetical protein
MPNLLQQLPAQISPLALLCKERLWQEWFLGRSAFAVLRKITFKILIPTKSRGALAQAGSSIEFFSTSRVIKLKPGLPDFFGAIYQNVENFTKLPHNKPIDHKII